MTLNAHGEGAIRWFEWRPETFELARVLDRPILLDLTAVWCHWCRMMDATSYADPEVTVLANELFVPIRVNVDRRPDISERYNFGSFPTTAILTPDGETIAGGTFIPPEELKPWLRSQSAYFKAQKNEIRRRIASFPVHVSGMETADGISTTIMRDVRQNLLESFDRVYGGFGTQPKFPYPDAIELALLFAVENRDDVFRRILTKTLDEMAIGGLFDRVDGGFHRYSTSRDWGSPHFEKMLDGNAALLRNYVQAYKLTGDEKYRRIGQRTLEYLLKTLRDTSHAAFYGSQAADEEYYTLSKDERTDKEQPPVDKTLYTNWNAHTITALLEAASIQQDGRQLISLCHELAGFLLHGGLDEEEGMHHYFDPQPSLTGLLSDNLEMARAMLELYMVSADSKDLESAKKLAEIIKTHFWDSANDGGFYDRLKEKAEGHLQRPEKNIHENSLAAEFFLKLAAITGDTEQQTIANRTLSQFTESYSELGPLASCYARSVELALSGAVRIEIVGTKEDPVFQEFLKVASNILEPRRVVLPLDVDQRRERIRTLQLPLSHETYAVACSDTSCSQPTREPSQLPEKVATITQQRFL